MKSIAVPQSRTFAPFRVMLMKSRYVNSDCNVNRTDPQCCGLNSLGFLVSALNKLHAFVFHIPNFSLWQKDASIKSKGHYISSYFPGVLLGFQSQDDLVVCVGNKLE